MKLQSLTFSILCLFFMLSCSSDDDNNTTIDANYLLAEWNLTEMHSEEGKLTITALGQSTSSSIETTGKDYDMQWLFSQEPNKFNIDGTFTTVTVTQGEDGPESEEDISDGLDSPYDWKLEGDSLILSKDGVDITYTIKKLDENSLIISYPFESSIDLSITKIDITATYFFSLEKVVK